MAEPAGRTLEFADFTLDLDAAELRRGGSVIPVEPQVFDLIAYLAAQAGRVVGRDEIIEAVWRGRVVSDSAVSTRINAARQALGDDGTLQRFIKTIHGRGFRFVAPAAEAPAASPIAPSPRKPSIAVLPFTNIGGEVEQEYFADGMAEDIIMGLSRFRSLLVTARNSSFAYKGKSPDARTVASDLEVRYVLEGSVRRSGQRVRVACQLIDAETGNHLWAERYERELGDIFAIQDKVTEAIVAAIAPEISDVERERAQRSPPGSFDAWGLYQRGLAAYYSSTEAGLKSAIGQFDEVNEIDPSFAPAYAMAAGARWRYEIHFDPGNRAELLNQALDKAYKAIKLDSRDATGHYQAGEVHSMLGEHDVAVLKVEEAIDLNPNDAIAHYFLGGVLRRAGRHEEAIPHFDHAMRLSPRDIWITGMLTDRAFVLFALERYEEALDWARRARLSPNPRTMTFAVFAAVLSALSRSEEAHAAVADMVAHAPGITGARYRNNLFGTPDTMARMVEALVEAGLPE